QVPGVVVAATFRLGFPYTVAQPQIAVLQLHLVHVNRCVFEPVQDNPAPVAPAFRIVTENVGSYLGEIENSSWRLIGYGYCADTRVSEVRADLTFAVARGQ